MLLLMKRSFLFIVTAVALIGSGSQAEGWRCARGGWAPAYGYSSCSPSMNYRYQSSYGCGVSRYTAPSCGEIQAPIRAPQAASGYKRYSTFEGGWVIVNQNDFIVDSSERRANGIVPAGPTQPVEQLPVPTPAPRLETYRAPKNPDLLSAPKRSQAPDTRYDGVDFFNAPKR